MFPLLLPRIWKSDRIYERLIVVMLIVKCKGAETRFIYVRFRSQARHTDVPKMHRQSNFKSIFLFLVIRESRDVCGVSIAWNCSLCRVVKSKSENITQSFMTNFAAWWTAAPLRCQDYFFLRLNNQDNIAMAGTGRWRDTWASPIILFISWPTIFMWKSDACGQ